jgi:dTDP-glucose 4,6-dehydratase
VWLWTILVRGELMRPYNVGSENAVSIAELAEAVAKAAGGHIPVVVAGTSTGAPPARYVPSTVRARNELGIDATVDLHAALARTLCWHLGGSSSHVEG